MPTFTLTLLSCLLGQSLFQKHFYDVYSLLIMDEVAAVRAATVEVIVPLSDELEESWLHKVFLKDLMDKMADTAARRANEYVQRCVLDSQTRRGLLVSCMQVHPLSEFCQSIVFSR